MSGLVVHVERLAPSPRALLSAGPGGRTQGPLIFLVCKFLPCLSVFLGLKRQERSVKRSRGGVVVFHARLRCELRVTASIILDVDCVCFLRSTRDFFTVLFLLLRQGWRKVREEARAEVLSASSRLRLFSRLCLPPKAGHYTHFVACLLRRSLAESKEQMTKETPKKGGRKEGARALSARVLVVSISGVTSGQQPERGRDKK